MANSPAQWLELAQGDLVGAEILAVHARADSRLAAQLFSASVEKAIKGAIALAGQQPDFIHDIAALGRRASALGMSPPIDLAIAQRLSIHATLFRYTPAGGPERHRVDLPAYGDAARAWVNWVADLIAAATPAAP